MVIIFIVIVVTFKLLKCETFRASFQKQVCLSIYNFEICLTGPLRSCKGLLEQGMDLIDRRT